MSHMQSITEGAQLIHTGREAQLIGLGDSNRQFTETVGDGVQLCREIVQGAHIVVGNSGSYFGKHFFQSGPAVIQ